MTLANEKHLAPDQSPELHAGKIDGSFTVAHTLRVTLLLGALVLAGCTTARKDLSTTGGGQTRLRNEGYSLLYELLSDESDVEKLLLIKRTDPPVVSLIKEIARTSGQAKKELELLRQQDPLLNLELTNLPHVELKTRAAIASTTTKQLLLSRGRTFTVRLLYTQAEAMNYAAHLAKVLQKEENNPARKKFLATLEPQCIKLHDRAMALLQ